MQPIIVIEADGNDISRSVAGQRDIPHDDVDPAVGAVELVTAGAEPLPLLALPDLVGEDVVC